VFLSDSIPGWVGPVGYCLLAAVGVGCIPLVYPPGEPAVAACRWLCDCLCSGLGKREELSSDDFDRDLDEDMRPVEQLEM
jgi:hypothetical protein